MNIYKKRILGSGHGALSIGIIFRKSRGKIYILSLENEGIYPHMLGVYLFRTILDRLSNSRSLKLNMKFLLWPASQKFTEGERMLESVAPVIWKIQKIVTPEILKNSKVRILDIYNIHAISFDDKMMQVSEEAEAVGI